MALMSLIILSYLAIVGVLTIAKRAREEIWRISSNTWHLWWKDNSLLYDILFGVTVWREERV